MPGNFNAEETLQKINDVERKFPVARWTVDRLAIWPFLRTALAYSQNRNPDTRGRGLQTGDVRSRIPSYLRVAASLPNKMLELRQLGRKSPRLFAGSGTHRANLNGLLINKYFDVAVRDFNARGTPSVILETTMEFSRRNYWNGPLMFSLPAMLGVLKMLKPLSGRRPTVSLEGYDEFCSYAYRQFNYEQALRRLLDRKIVDNRLQSLFFRKEVLKRFLGNSSIETFYAICYYSSMLYPVTAACNELGIATVDIQHGGIGRGHYSYDRWINIPDGGYSLLPRYFWVWDKPTAALIDDWARPTGFHCAYTGGNPWNTDCYQLFETPAGRDGYILYNMTEVTLDSFVADAIRHSMNQYRWVLRMHPRQSQHRESLQQQINELGISDQAEIEDSVDVPLAVSLHYSAMFLSKASGSVIEAVELGYRPVLLRSLNMSYYDHFIKEGKVTVLNEDSASYLIEHIRNGKAYQRRPLPRIDRTSTDSYLAFERFTGTQAKSTTTAHL